MAVLGDLFGGGGLRFTLFAGQAIHGEVKSHNVPHSWFIMERLMLHKISPECLIFLPQIIKKRKFTDVNWRLGGGACSPMGAALPQLLAPPDTIEGPVGGPQKTHIYDLEIPFLRGAYGRFK